MDLVTKPIFTGGFGNFSDKDLPINMERDNFEAPEQQSPRTDLCEKQYSSHKERNKKTARTQNKESNIQNNVCTKLPDVCKGMMRSKLRDSIIGIVSILEDAPNKKKRFEIERYLDSIISSKRNTKWVMETKKEIAPLKNKSVIPSAQYYKYNCIVLYGICNLDYDVYDITRITSHPSLEKETVTKKDFLQLAPKVKKCINEILTDLVNEKSKKYDVFYKKVRSLIKDKTQKRTLSK